MIPDLDILIQRQWADDEEYVATCRAMELNLDVEWEIEARLRSPTHIPSFLQEKLRRQWREVLVIPARRGGQELVLRREQPLTLDDVKEMSASLLRLAHTYSLDWLNWAEFDGHIHRSLGRQLDWTFERSD